MFSHSVHPFLDNTILPYIILKIYSRNLIYSILDMECQEKINEDMAYALSYLSIYSNQLNVPKMHREMNNLMIITVCQI